MLTNYRYYTLMIWTCIGLVYFTKSKKMPVVSNIMYSYPVLENDYNKLFIMFAFYLRPYNL